MNSEIPSTPESNNFSFESVEPENEQSEAQLEENNDVWNNAEDFEPQNSETDRADTKAIIFEPQSVATPDKEPDPPESSDLVDPEKFDLAIAKEQSETVVEPTSKEPELFADRWLEESENLQSDAVANNSDSTTLADKEDVDSLTAAKTKLQQEIADLKAQKEQMLLEQITKAQGTIGQMVEEGTRELIERKTELQVEIEKLERRRERINQEMRRNFAGSSQELAVRVQGFKNYLVGSLQDLAAAADKLELGQKETATPRNRDRSKDRESPRRTRDREESFKASRRDRERGTDRSRDRGERRSRNEPPSASAQFSEPTFAEQGRRIRQLLDKYRNSPDYYGSPWQLRRTFDASHAQRVQDWFFTQGGRGAIDSMGSRLQNILVASAAISVLHNLYGDRCRVLVLTDTPENLGEWRRGLQDCLGISRSSFGANRGVVLFDSPEVLIQGAERLIRDKLLPIIVVDETEELLNLSVLKFPIWLAFASKGKTNTSNYLY